MRGGGRVAVALGGSVMDAGGPMAQALGDRGPAVAGEGGVQISGLGGLSVRLGFWRVPQPGHSCSALTCLISALRPEYDAWPTMRAAIRPLRSITRVVGMLAGGTVPLKSRATRSFGSFRLG